MNYISHPLMKPDSMESREYQVSMGNLASRQNSLVVLPTSLGKTMIALLSLVKVLEKFPESKILVLAPTRPLVFQHFETFQNFLDPSVKCCLFSSNLSPIQRAYSLNDHNIFFSTPQIIQNDLKAELYTLSGIGQIIFDETHKARKKYAYTFVAQKYLEQCSHPLVLGLTASPGNDLFRINELCQTLQIERIIFRERESLDIQKYVHPISSNVHLIDPPTKIIQASGIIDTAIRKIRNYLVDQEIFPKRNFTSKFQFIQLIQDLKKLDFILDEYEDYSEKLNFDLNHPENALHFPHLLDIFDPKLNQKLPNKPAIISRAIDGIYLEHLKEILTTQDIRMFWNYLRKLNKRAEDGNYRVRKFLHSKYILGAKKILGSEKFSPKIPKLILILLEELENDPNGKFIIFTQYREMGNYLTQELNQNPVLKKLNIKTKRFVGQASCETDKGLSQKQQISMIHGFKDEKFKILVATSVAEEGLDIPNVTAVIFYDMVPSEIRLIQRRGRTGRHKPGICHYLINKGTLDSIYFHVSNRKEQKMHDLLKNPQLVQTVAPILRSKEPIHQKQTLDEIKTKYTERKERANLQNMNKLEEEIEKHSFPNSQRRKSSKIPTKYQNASHLVNDYTKTLTQAAISKQKKSQNRVNSRNGNKSKNKTFLTRYIFDWIYTTMVVLGSTNKDYTYCDLDELYQAATEEDIDPIKIQKEIAYGIKCHIFQTNQSQLIYINS